MIVLWTVWRVWVALLLCGARYRAEWAQHHWDACVAQSHDPEASGWEKMQAEHRLKVWERRVKRRNERVNVLEARGKWIAGLRTGQLSYVAAVLDLATPWVFWALERSGTFDLWAWGTGHWDSVTAFWG